jgi:hypothetical protein
MTAIPGMLAPRKVVVCGTPFDRGLQHGRALRNEIRALLADHRARIDLARPRPLTDTEARRAVDAHREIIERDLPAIAEELNGLAEGARISYEDAVLLQARRELIGVVEHGAQGDCTLGAYRRGPGDAVIAQTVDVNGNLRDAVTVLHVLPSRPGEPEMLLLTFAGLLGYLGMNSFGVAVGINLVISSEWGAGVPSYLLVRHLLGQETVESCLSEIRRVRRGSSRALTIADRRRLVVVEMTRDEECVLESDVLYHTNHYLQPDMVVADRMNALSRNNSRRRLLHIEGALAGRAPETSIEELFDVFVDHRMHPFGVCAHAEGNPRRGETVATVVLEPGKGHMHVRPGLPCGRAPRLTFDLGRAAA